MYKMIAIDLDGTLFSTARELSKRDIEMLNRVYEEKGVIPVITTGRLTRCAETVASMVGSCLSQYVIAINGAYVKDNLKGIFINNKIVDKNEAKRLIEFCEEKNILYLFQTRDEAIISIKHISKISGNTEINNRLVIYYNFVEDVLEYINRDNIELYSMGMFGNTEDLQLCIDKVEETHILQNLGICTNAKGTKYIDIMQRGCNKGEAIRMLSEYLGITKDEVVAIGDGANDIEMFEVAGFSVAMGNAQEVLKEKADYITASNNESGVAKAIKHIFYN